MSERSDSQNLSANRLYEVLKKSKYDPTKEPPADTTILSIDGRQVGTLGNFIAFTGRPKVGKTTFLSAALASAMVPFDVWGLKITLPDDRPFIQYYDTEQSAYQFHRLMNRAKKMMGMDNLPRAISGFLLREFPAAELMKLIEHGIKLNPKCSCVFIDGLLDLCENFNDEGESKKVINWLKKITKVYNILVIGVIHQSKKEQYTLGHLGSAIDRYAESTLLIEKDQTKKYITLSAQLLRNTIDEFPPITIMFNGTDFVKADTPLKTATRALDKGPWDYQDGEHKVMLSELIPEVGCSYDDLILGIYELKALSSKAKGRTFVKYWREQGYVFVDKDKIYHRSIDSKLFIASKN